MKTLAVSTARLNGSAQTLIAAEAYGKYRGNHGPRIEVKTGDVFPVAGMRKTIY